MLRQLVGALPIPNDERILRGFQDAEDAAVYQLDDGSALVLSVDVITPIVDDPYQFGVIAAANSLSDIFAMGGKGLVSLSILSVSTEVPPEAAVEIVRGGCDVAAACKAPVLGGHSVEGQDILFGLAAVGIVQPDKMLANDGLKPGDQLVLTKPLGTGTMSTAYKRDAIDLSAMQPVIDGMMLTNGAAVDHLHAAGVRAATDVTGFGLLGHSAEMALASGVQIVIESASVPDYPGARQQMQDGYVTRGNKRNREYVEGLGPLVGEVEPLLLDPQTSGGLLVAVRPEQLDALVTNLRAAGYGASQRVGQVESGEGLRIVP